MRVGVDSDALVSTHSSAARLADRRRDHAAQRGRGFQARGNFQLIGRLAVFIRLRFAQIDALFLEPNLGVVEGE